MPLSPRKRILMVLLFALLVVLIAYALYRVFFKPLVPGAPPVTPPAAEAPPTFPIAPEAPVPAPEAPPAARPEAARPGISPVAAGGLTAVTNLLPANALHASLNAEGNAVNFWNSVDNKFYRVARDGRLTQLSARTFAKVENATWSPAGNQAILEFPDGSNIFFDFNTQKQATLPSHWEEFDFNPTGGKIVAKSLARDENNRFLIVANSNGSEARAVALLGNAADRVIPTWSPNNQTVAISQTGEPVPGSGGERQIVYLVNDSGTANYPKIVVEGRGLRTQWSPSGNQMLYSAYNGDSGFNPHLWIVSTEPGKEGARKIDVELDTWANKCAFADETTLYCAVPTFLEDGYGLVPELANNIPDQIYKVDLETGTRTLLASPEGDPAITSLMLAPDESAIYFTDNANEGINLMRLR